MILVFHKTKHYFAKNFVKDTYATFLWAAEYRQVKG